MKFLGSSSVILEDPPVRYRLLEPVEKLGGRVDLIIVLAFWEHAHLVQILGEPRCRLRNMDEAIFDHRGLCVQPHDLIALRLIARDAMAAFDDQLLDQLGAGGFVFDQYDIGAEEALLLAPRV